MHIYIYIYMVIFTTHRLNQSVGEPTTTKGANLQATYTNDATYLSKQAKKSKLERIVPTFQIRDRI